MGTEVEGDVEGDVSVPFAVGRLPDGVLVDVADGRDRTITGDPDGPQPAATTSAAIAITTARCMSLTYRTTLARFLQERQAVGGQRR